MAPRLPTCATPSAAASSPPAPGAIAKASEVYNLRYNGAHPLAIVQAKDGDDVKAAVKWAGKRDVRVLPRSGGHSYAGYSTGDGVLVIDLSNLHSIDFHRSSGTVEIEPGAQLIDVYLKLAKHGVTIPAGSCPSVGIGGHALGGGMGLAGRSFGLTCDNLREVAVVTANGERVVANAHQHPDLFWASRGGGGGNFGVTTKLRLKVHSASHASHFNVSWPFSSAPAALDAWQDLVPKATRNLTSIFHLNAGGSSPTVSANGQYFGPESHLHSLLSPLLSVPGASLSTGTLGYAKLMLYWAGCASISHAACHTVGTHRGGTFPRERFLAKSDYVSKKLSSSGRHTLVKAIERRQADLAGGSVRSSSTPTAARSTSPARTRWRSSIATSCSASSTSPTSRKAGPTPRRSGRTNPGSRCAPTSPSRPTRTTSTRTSRLAGRLLRLQLQPPAQREEDLRPRLPLPLRPGDQARLTPPQPAEMRIGPVGAG